MRKKKAAGFTLVELIVVIAVMGILGATGSVAYTAYIRRANDANVLSRLSEVSYAGQTAAQFNKKPLLGMMVSDSGKAVVSVSGGTIYSDFYSSMAEYIDDAEVTASGWAVDIGGLQALMAKSPKYAEGALWSPTGGWTSIDDIDFIMANPELVSIFSESAFSTEGTPEQLMKSVNSLTITMERMLGGGAIDILMEDADIQNYMKSTMKLSDDQIKALSANQKAAISVMYVASKLRGKTVDDVAAMTEGKNLSTYISRGSMSGDDFSAVAAEYATMLGYAYTHPDAEVHMYKSGCSGITQTSTTKNMKDYLTSGTQIGGTNLTGIFGEMAKNSDYQAYKKTEDGQRDIEGFLAAMSMIDDNRNNLTLDDISSSKYFTDPAVLNILGTILGE